MQFTGRRPTESATLRLKNLASPQPKSWSHSQFLAGFVGKFVVVTPKGAEAGYIGKLLAFDQWSLLVAVIYDDKGSTEETLVFKHSVDCVLAHNPDLHGKLPGVTA